MFDFDQLFSISEFRVRRKSLLNQLSGIDPKSTQLLLMFRSFLTLSVMLEMTNVDLAFPN